MSDLAVVSVAFLTFGCVAMLTSFEPWRLVAPIRPQMHLLLDLIELDRDWQKAKHAWYHPSGVNIWVGNSGIGLAVKWGSTGINDYPPLHGAGPNRLNHREWKRALQLMERDRRGCPELRRVAERVAAMYSPSPSPHGDKE